MEDQIITLITQQNDLLQRIYTADLFVIGAVSAVGVTVLLYKFIRLFF